MMFLPFHRSPWSNTYDPPLEDGAMPSERIRKLEVETNAAFDQYREMYFEGGVSSVYLWDLDHGFAGVILIKKAGDGSKKIKGYWDSIHVVEVQVRDCLYYDLAAGFTHSITRGGGGDGPPRVALLVYCNEETFFFCRDSRRQDAGHNFIFHENTDYYR